MNADASVLSLSDGERLYLCAMTPWIYHPDDCESARYKMLSKIDMEGIVEIVVYQQKPSFEKHVLGRVCTKQENFYEWYREILTTLRENLGPYEDGTEVEFDLFSQDQMSKLTQFKCRDGKMTLLSRLRHFLYRRKIRKMGTVEVGIK